jgi:hypothetical protein
MLIQIVLLIRIEIFGANEAVFETPRFRLWAAAAILALVGTVRVISYLAYAHTTAMHAVRRDRDPGELIPRTSGAILRFLLRLHHGFTGTTADGQSVCQMSANQSEIRAKHNVRRS